MPTTREALEQALPLLQSLATEEARAAKRRPQALQPGTMKRDAYQAALDALNEKGPE